MIKNSRWPEWWHAIGADAGRYLKLPSKWFGQRAVYMEGYLEGVRDAARVIEKHRWSKQDGHDIRITNAIKGVHAFHGAMEERFQK